MRSPWTVAASVTLAAVALPAQTTPRVATDSSGATVVTVAQAPSRETVRRQLDQVRLELEGRRLPVQGDVVWGDRTVNADERVQGPIVAAGQLDVYGLVRGDAIALGGDVVVHAGGHVSGDAVSAGGRVRMGGGSVDGEQLVLAANLLPAATTGPATPADARSGMALSAGWLVMLLFIGIGVLVFAGTYLEGVVTELERNFTRALLVGFAGELALVPILVVVCIALILTVIGVLLVPFAVVALVLATAGLLTLGYLAVARVLGTSLTRTPPGLSTRGQALRSLVVGLAALLGLWIVAAGLEWVPVAGWALRGIAFAITWVAATAGFGAAILSRAGTRREEEIDTQPVRKDPSLEALAWQTPTPVTGVAAARRPTPVATKH